MVFWKQVLHKMKLKSLNRSVWTPIFYGISGVLIFFYMFLVRFFSKGFLSDWEKVLSYPNVAIGILTIGMTIFWTQREPEFERSLYSSAQMHGRRFLAMFRFVFRFFLIVNLLTFALNLFHGVRWDFALRFLFQLTFDLSLAIALQILAGILLGILIPNSYAYIGAVPFALLFSPVPSNFTSVPNAVSLLNPFIKDVSASSTPQFYPWFDVTFFYEKLFSIALILFLASLLLFISTRGRYHKIASVLCMFCTFYVMYRLTPLYGESLSSEKYLWTNGNEECAALVESEDYTVEEIHMKLTTGDLFRNEVQLLVRKVNKETEPFSFLLEEALSAGIRSFTLNGEDLSYTVQGQQVSVKIPEEIPVDSTFLLNLVYEGRIKYSIKPGGLFYMANRNNLHLPPSFPWYPFTGEKSVKKYVIDLAHGDLLLTNLNEYRLLPAGETHLEGNVHFLFLSVGDYLRQQVGDREVIAAREFLLKDNDLRSFWEIADWWEEDTQHHPDTYILIPHMHLFSYPDGKNVLFSQLF